MQQPGYVHLVSCRHVIVKGQNALDPVTLRDKRACARNALVLLQHPVSLRQLGAAMLNLAFAAYTPLASAEEEEEAFISAISGGIWEVRTAQLVCRRPHTHTRQAPV